MDLIYTQVRDMPDILKYFLLFILFYSFLPYFTSELTKKIFPKFLAIFSLPLFCFPSNIHLLINNEQFGYNDWSTNPWPDY